MFLLSKIVLSMFSGQILIFLGLTFLSEKLLPSIFANFYATTPTIIKLIIFAFIVSIPANLLFSYGYKISSGAIAGSIYIVTAIIIMIITALLIDGVKPNLQIFMASSCLLGSAVWLVESLR